MTISPTSEPFDVADKKIVIVGAGIAGLNCAVELLRYGFVDITILEADNRVGGRIYSHGLEILDDNRMENCFIEMGAQHVNRGSNIIYEIATQDELLDDTAPDYYDALKNLNTVYTPDVAKIISDLAFYFAQLYYLPKHAEEILESKDFEDYFKNQNTALLKYYAKGVYNWHFRLVYEYTFLPAELKTAYKDLLAKFMQALPSDMVHYNKEVMEIDWDEVQPKEVHKHNTNPKIKIMCRDDTSYYEADNVIVTIPLGYLQKHIDSLFKPRLSEDKENAIKAIPFVTLNKIFLMFDNPFWNIPDVFHVIWDDTFDELFKNERDSNLVCRDGKKWMQCITHFEYVANNPKVLQAFIWNEGAEIMENLSKETITRICMQILKHLLKRLLPEPEDVFWTGWHNNPLYRGSLPFDQTKSTVRHASKIAESVLGGISGCRPVILFAGDATSIKDPASVHGAAETGMRAALKLYTYYHDVWNQYTEKRGRENIKFYV